jgi:hypothetical protein
MTPGRSSSAERGSVTLWLVITVVGLFAAVGLVADGGQALAAKGRAISDAYGAARAGAEALDRAAFTQGGPPAPDPAAARSAAATFLSEAGADPGRALITITAQEVTVTVTLTSPTELLGALGINGLTVTGRGQARAIYGIPTSGGRP